MFVGHFFRQSSTCQGDFLPNFSNAAPGGANPPRNFQARHVPAHLARIPPFQEYIWPLPHIRPNPIRYVVLKASPAPQLCYFRWKSCLLVARTLFSIHPQGCLFLPSLLPSLSSAKFVACRQDRFPPVVFFPSAVLSFPLLWPCMQL